MNDYLLWGWCSRCNTTIHDRALHVCPDGNITIPKGGLVGWFIILGFDVLISVIFIIVLWMWLSMNSYTPIDNITPARLVMIGMMMGIFKHNMRKFTEQSPLSLR